MGKIRIWGIASGIGATRGAMAGAFTWREYDSEADIERKDWLHIIFKERMN